MKDLEIVQKGRKDQRRWLSLTLTGGLVTINWILWWSILMKLMAFQILLKIKTGRPCRIANRKWVDHIPFKLTGRCLLETSQSFKIKWICSATKANQKRTYTIKFQVDLSSMILRPQKLPFWTCSSIHQLKRNKGFPKLIDENKSFKSYRPN